MRNALITVALCLASLGHSAQLAFADAPTNCVKSDQRCRDQGVARIVCQSRFNYCAAYNRALGLNWSGQPLPGRVDRAKSGVVSTSGSVVSNSAVIGKRPVVVTGGSTVLSAPGTFKLKVQ